MTPGQRWTISDRFGNEIYLTDERWEHIIYPNNHPEMIGFEEELRETIRSGARKQDSLNPRKYRYVKAFNHLAQDNTHIVAIVLFGFMINDIGQPTVNNYIVTAYQQEIG